MTRRGVQLGCRSPRIVDDAWVVPVAGGQQARLAQVATRLPSHALPSFHLPAGDAAPQNAPDAHQVATPDADSAWDDGAWGQ